MRKVVVVLMMAIGFMSCNPFAETVDTPTNDSLEVTVDTLGVDTLNFTTEFDSLVIDSLTVDSVFVPQSSDSVKNS